MGFLAKFIVRILLNGAALYIAKTYFSGFVLTGGTETLIIGAIVLALLNTFLRPILKFISTPLIWLSFGLFNLVIYIIILWLADALLLSLSISDLMTLFWVSLIVALANII